MGRLLEDLERQIEEERARAQQKKLEEARKNAEKRAKELEAQRRRNQSGWIL